ncbi:MAG: hypothetical protein A3D16_23590 [Rhodobacterales bacterium RIFCSPHIGHO2_02_FULL_62_130]|nr:MAG: hypothetical protein A3D16_23590 [Rhodobacterales bacterium RIFCSPHIGHO2_02_FULL_62_130]OHC59498.1 MAG: hypothetical protein A3E48_18200 [Rhodobacterales bacterium RIFCSPHIGHO2_12_FULL_62_75]HCY99435.1 hypothetical protein [Rhodobacter sp.]
MSYLFAIPPQYQALVEAGKLIRRGALLINADGGGIVAHLQETRGFAKGGFELLSKLGAGNPISMAGQVANLAASGVMIRQNQQIKQTLNEVRDTLDFVKGIGVANLATSVVGIGVTVAATAVLVQRIESLRVNLENFAKEVTEFRDEWRTNELEKLLQAASTELDRIDGVHRRVNGRPVLEAAERDLHHVFDQMAARARSLFMRKEIPVAAVRIVLDGLSISGSARIKALFLMDEAEEAKASAQAQVKNLMDMTIAMPADRLAGRLVGTTSHREEAAALSARMASMRDTAVGILPLVDELQRQDLRASAYLVAAEKEEDAPLMFLPAKVK